MSNVAEIEGIGEVIARKLNGAGIVSTDDLLREGASRAGREHIAERAGLTTQQVLEFVNRADLMRVKGIGPQYSDLLEAAGVDSVKELARRDPENLLAKILEVNEARHLVNRPPNLEAVKKIVGEAKELPGIVTH
ncbi:MAG TPA: DUF4332 domain-containing protein [Deinococcales bacterium]|nr:DUF4332 domain-containing protein [Deinococcales bacterium]